MIKSIIGAIWVDVCRPMIKSIIGAIWVDASRRRTSNVQTLCGLLRNLFLCFGFRLGGFPLLRSIGRVRRLGLASLLSNFRRFSVRLLFFPALRRPFSSLGPSLASPLSRAPSLSLGLFRVCRRCVICFAWFVFFPAIAAPGAFACLSPLVRGLLGGLLWRLLWGGLLLRLRSGLWSFLG